MHNSLCSTIYGIDVLTSSQFVYSKMPIFINHSFTFGMKILHELYDSLLCDLLNQNN